MSEKARETLAGGPGVQPSDTRIFFSGITADGGLDYIDQSDENGAFNSAATRLSALPFQPQHLNLSLTQDGYLGILAIDAARGTPTFIHENREASAPTRFSAPLDLGLPSGVSTCLDTALVNGVTGRLSVFLTSAASDNAIWWRYQNPNTITEETLTVVPPGTETPVEITVPVQQPPEQLWGDWQQLPGALCQITTTQNGDNRIVLAGINAAGSAYLTLQSSERPLLPEGWLAWQDISGGLSGFEQLLCATDGAALVHIFARIGTSIYMRVQTGVGSNSFSDWVLFAAFPDAVGDMAVALSSVGGLYLVAQVGSGPGFAVYAKYQLGCGGADWSTPQVIAQLTGDSTLALQANANTALSLFALDKATGVASTLTQHSLAHWNIAWTTLTGSYATIATAQDVTPSPA
ncbi:hypothetical protein [Arenibacterium sp. LLYu02]|uniref:hypothetical protein n=1 Tax=Arenibacterium sp. LLYu02 TaxID=3404132 RepID=UPI003B20D648